MGKKIQNRFYVFALAIILVIGTVIPGMMVMGSEESTEESETLVLAQVDTTEELDELSRYGEVMDHYGRNVLIETTNVEELEEHYDIYRLEHRNELIVKGYTFDTNHGLPELNEEMTIENYEPGTEGIYLVDMIGPVNSEWRERLEAKGVEVMNYVPNYAYRVRMTPEVAERVEDLFFVDWIGIYQPEFKLQSGIEPGMVEIGLVSGTDYRTIEEIKDIAGMGSPIHELNEFEPASKEEDPVFEMNTPVRRAERLEEKTSDTTPFSYVELPNGEYRVRVELESEEDIREIAMMNEVYYISEYVEPELHEVESQLVGGGLYFMMDDGTPMNQPYREHGEYGAYINQIGYTGDGVTITIADTGIGDGVEGDAGHPDFTDRVIGGHVWNPVPGEPDGWQDGHYHGTHCAGLAAGNTHGGTGETYAGEETGPYYLAQGLAYDSELFSAKIFGDTGADWVGPQDYREIVEIPAQESDTYVHSNSWGADTGGLYIISDHDFDAAVRDADRSTDENEEMVLTASAGNAGPGYQTIGSPGNAKNVIVVGATHTWYPDGLDYGGANRENPENIIGYSSRGWTADNRVKPDVVAPADLTLSTQTSLSMGNYGPNPEQYRWMGGTSSSNPVVAGAAAVVVEWYEEEFGERPSPAMVRSLLINTANELDDEVGNTEGSIPNRDEGWGMVDLTKLEYPHDDPIPFYTEDQENVITTSGQVYEHEIEYVHEDEPLKITLGWTDKEAPPDTETGPTLINDLNLEVESPGGHIYRGNAFEDGWTQRNQDTMEEFDRTGDGWDDTNNVENVYIPPEELEAGVYTVRVKGWNIPEDALGVGVPSQDYALTAYNADEGELVDEPPSIELESPTGGEDWDALTEEDIEWTAAEGDHDLSHINIFYTQDGGSEWTFVEELAPEESSYTWTIPNVHTDEAQVRVRVIDDVGNFAEDTSDDFTIDGIPPAPPEYLLAEPHYLATETVFEDDVSEDKGYTTGSSQGINEWDIREHGAYVGDQSWDWGDMQYEKIGEVSWLRSPEIDLTEAENAELTFQHWRQIESMWDGANLKASTDGATWELVDPEPGYDGMIETGWENPLEGEPAWWGTQDWEEVTVDLGDYVGETIWLSWEAGVENFPIAPGQAGWRIDDIEVTIDVLEEEPVNNRLRWYASEDDPEEVSHYNVYRAEEDDGPWNDPIGSVEADGSEIYHYMDEEMAGDPYYWYVVRAVGTNGLEEGNEDAKQEYGDPDVDVPEIVIDEPDSDSVWDANTEEFIRWTTDVGEEDIDYIDHLWYSIDAGESWESIDGILADEDYEWTVPNWPSEEAMIRARVVDEAGRYSENTSDEFEIVGEAPLPAENLDVRHVTASEDWYWMYPEEHRTEVDNAIGLTGPGIWYGAIRTELPAGELKDIAYFDFNAANHVKGQIYTDGFDEPGELIVETEEVTDLGNMQWTEIPLEETVRIEEGHYWVVLEIDDIGDGFQPLGCVAPFVDDGGWLSLDGEMWDETIDFGLDQTWTIEANVETIDEDGNQDNLISWDSSPHDPFEGPSEITHYDLYRAESDWEDEEHIATITADGSEDYMYIDEGKGMADDIFWWYNVTAVARNEMEAEHDDAVQEPIPPEITITSPEEGDVWEYGETETISWNITQTVEDISHVDLWYSLDDGETTYGLIEEGIPADEGEGTFDWEIPVQSSEEARIIGIVFDVENNTYDNMSERFTLIGEHPEPPEGLLVEYDHYDTETVFEDNVSEDKGYITGSSEGVNEWARREHDAVVGDHSWDYGDTEYEKIGEVSWLISPEIDLTEARDAELTFQHWREIDPFWDGANLKVTTDLVTADLLQPEPGYDGVIESGWGNPLEGQPGWWGTVDWEEVTVDLGDYAGESIHLIWEVGVEDYPIEPGQTGWRIDDIEVTAEVPQEEPVSNRLRWFPSEDDPEGVSHYNIYRSEEEGGPWNDTTLIDSVDADGSEEYHYIDPDTAGEPYYWYVVRAVDHYGLEEENEDAKQEPGDPDVQEPEITIEQPDGDSEWHAYAEENITWSTEEGDALIDYVELWYSTDGGDTWTEIATMLDPEEEHEWTVPNWPSEEALIGARVVDDAGRYGENMSEEFEIVGQGPRAPRNLDVEHGAPADWYWEYPAEHRADFESALGLPVEMTWYAAIRTELPEGHVTDIAYFDLHPAWSVQGYLHEDGEDAPGDLIGQTEVLDVDELGTFSWQELEMDEPVTIEEGHYWIVLEIEDIGEDFFPFGTIFGYTEDAGYISVDGATWDTLEDNDMSWLLEARVQEEGRDDNLITWDASEDDPADGRPEEVSHYDIYRAEEDWDDAEHIGTVEADGSVSYEFVDPGKGMADDIFWWYNVTAVAHNEMDNATEAVREPIPPEITITSPEEGDEWEYGDTETITWETTEHEYEIDHVDLYYSLDGGATIYDQIAEGLDHTDGEVDWTIPDVYSEDARIVGYIYDVEDNRGENVSESFNIIGEPPEPPERLRIEHDGDDNLLRWRASPDDELGNVSHYNIYRREDIEDEWDHIDSVDAARSHVYEYRDHDAAGEPYYWYIVRTVDRYGQEEMNEDASYEPGDPEIDEPQVSVDEPGADDVWYFGDEEEIVFWLAGGDHDLEYVDLYYRTAPGYDWNLIEEDIAPELGENVYGWTVPEYYSNQVQIRAVVEDSIGYTGEDISEEFTILEEEDEVPPHLEITAPEYGAVLSQAIIEWYGSDDESGISHFEIWHPVDEVWIDVGENTSHEFTDLEDGEYEVTVRAWDVAGNNATDTISFTLDTTEPEVMITSPEHGEILTEDSVTVLWVGYDETTEIVDYEVQINDEGWHSVGLRTWYEFEGLPDGHHTVEVRATDEAGHNATDTIDIYVATDPLLEITAPEGGVESLTFEEDFTIQGETYQWLTVHINGVEVDVVDGEFVYDTSLAEGQNIFTVTVSLEGEKVHEMNVYALYLPQIQEMQEDIERIDGEIDDIYGEIDEIRLEISDLQAEIEELRVELEEAVGELEAEIEELRVELEEAVGELEAEIEELESNIDALEADITTLETDLGELSEQVDSLEGELGDVQDEVEWLQDELNELEQDIEDLESELADARDDIAGLTADLDALGNDLDQLEQDLNDFQDEQEAVDSDQDDDIDMARNLSLVGMILAILAIVLAVVAMQKKPAEKETEYEEEDVEELEEDEEEETFGEDEEELEEDEEEDW